MSANRSVATATLSPQAGASTQVGAQSVQRAGAGAGRFAALVPVRRWFARMSEDWLPRVGWSLQRTGQLGLSGLGLLVASAIFLVSTHLPLARELDDLRAQVQSTSLQSAVVSTALRDSGTALLRSLPARGEMPAVLGTLLKQADAAHLSIDTGKYETTPLKSGGVMTYQISFPVTGPYPQVRQFIDSTLAALPAAAMTELSITRKAIGDGAVEAQIRLTVFTRDSP